MPLGFEVILVGQDNPVVRCLQKPTQMSEGRMIGVVLGLEGVETGTGVSVETESG